MRPHVVRLRKRLDPQSLVAAERHPATGRLAPNGRRHKSARNATLARAGFTGATGVLAAGALVTLVAGTAAAAVKSGGHPTRSAHTVAVPPRANSPRATAPAAAKSLPAPCELVSQSAAQRAVGVPVDTSENKPTSCLYAASAAGPFRTVEIRYDPHFDPAHVRRTLSAARVAATSIAGLGSASFSHPAFVQTANGQTQFLPAEAVVPVGSLTVVISAITLDEGNGAKLVDPARDEAAAVGLAQAVLAPYAGQ